MTVSVPSKPVSCEALNCNWVPAIVAVKLLKVVAVEPFTTAGVLVLEGAMVTVPVEAVKVPLLVSPAPVKVKVLEPLAENVWEESIVSELALTEEARLTVVFEGGVSSLP